MKTRQDFETGCQQEGGRFLEPGLDSPKNGRFQEDPMPRRSILSVAERDSLLALPATQDELIRH